MPIEASTTTGKNRAEDFVNVHFIIVLHTVWWIEFDASKRHHNNVNLHELDLSGADYLMLLCFSVSIFTYLPLNTKYRYYWMLNQVINSLKLTHCDTWWNVNKMTALPFISFIFFPLIFRSCFSTEHPKGEFQFGKFNFANKNGKKKGNQLFLLVPLIWWNESLGLRSSKLEAHAFRK